jgi:hypothetical protein
MKFFVIILNFLTQVLSLKLSDRLNIFPGFRYNIIEDKKIINPNNFTMLINASLNNVEIILTNNNSTYKKIDILTNLTEIIKSLGSDYEDVRNI